MLTSVLTLGSLVGMSVISRKAAVAMAMAVTPITALAAIYAPHGPILLLACLWSAVVVLLAGLFTWMWSRRLRELTGFADRMLDVRAPGPRVRLSDDELGDLGRSLMRAVPQVAELGRGLDLEIARRRAVLAGVSEAVLAVDSKLNVSFCNDSFRDISRHEVEEGVPLIKVLRDPSLMQVLKRVIDSREAVRQRLKMSVPEAHSFEVYAAPLADAFSVGALAILNDVTPAERLERTRRDFVANVSHEFRTPLASIAGYTETLLNGGLEDEQNRRKFVEIIQANSVRLNMIAADLLTLSELDSGRPVIEPHPIEIGNVIQTTLNALEPVAKLHRVHLRFEPVSGLHVLGYHIRFEQALLNLLDNAIKFNKPSGEVTVQAVSRTDDQVEISVTDTGIGIPAEDLSRIFERFYRVDKARSRQVGGTGLGLSIVRHAIEQMHGTIKVESGLGKGSCFTITLPRHGIPNPVFNTTVIEP